MREKEFKEYCKTVADVPWFFYKTNPKYEWERCKLTATYEIFEISIEDNRHWMEISTPSFSIRFDSRDEETTRKINELVYEQVEKIYG